MHPARVVGIQFHRAAHDRGASLELAGVHNLQSQDPERVSVERIEGHRALGRGTKRREVLAEEVRLRQRDQRELVRPIQLDRAPGRSQGPIERGRVVPGSQTRIRRRRSARGRPTGPTADRPAPPRAPAGS